MCRHFTKYLILLRASEQEEKQADSARKPKAVKGSRGCKDTVVAEEARMQIKDLHVAYIDCRIYRFF